MKRQRSISRVDNRFTEGIASINSTNGQLDAQKQEIQQDSSATV